MKNIVLVGFMGTGKTAVGKELSRQLKARFISTDDIIEEREKKPITRIFEDSGEQYFRGIEKSVVKEVSALDSVVIAAGGGVVLDEENISNLKKNGTLVCLTATPEVIYKRTRNYKHRPLLNVADPVAKIKELLEARWPFYARADIQINASSMSVKETANEIRRLLNV